MAIISAWRNLTSSKLKKSLKRKNRKQGQLLSKSGFVLCVTPPTLSRDRRIKMKKSLSKTVEEIVLHQNAYSARSSEKTWRSSGQLPSYLAIHKRQENNKQKHPVPPKKKKISKNKLASLFKIKSNLNGVVKQFSSKWSIIINKFYKQNKSIT